MKKTLFITGGLGFVGSHFIKHVLANDPDVQIVNVDKMTYAAVDGTRFGPPLAKSIKTGFLDRPWVERLGNNNHGWIHADVVDEKHMREAAELFPPSAFVHFAAETHVDRSIDRNFDFLRTNLLGTRALLEVALWVYRRTPVPDCFRFVYVSTDEVYGPCTKHGGFNEDERLNPRNPYAATKAGAEHLVMSYHHTYGLPVLIVRGANTYGPYQYPEKLLPLMILNNAGGKVLPVYGDGKQVREWLHVLDHVEGICAVLKKGIPGSAYNIGSGENLENLTVIQSICGHMGKGAARITHVEDRPGHDRRYAIYSGKLRGLGWQPKVSFLRGGLSAVIGWYLGEEGRDWCARISDHARDRVGIRKS